MRRDLPGPPNDPRTGQSLASLASPAKTVMFCEVQGLYGNVKDPLEQNGYNFVTSGVTNGASSGQVYPGGRMMTGCLGGLDCSSNVLTGPNHDEHFAALTGLHTDGSNFLMTDCHAKWLRGSQISGGMTAMAEDCNQNGTPGVPDCNSRAANNGMSEGTGGSKFAATFSTK